MRPSSWFSRRRLIALAAAGLLAGGVLETTSHASAVFLIEATEAVAQLAGANGEPTQTAAGGRPTAPANPAAPGQDRGPVMGAVTAISQEPASFIVRTQEGEALTFRVLDITVFAAPPDRPYRFGLLKVGDLVRVRGGIPRPGQLRALEAMEAQVQCEAQPQTGRPPRGAAGRQGLELREGEMVARLVLVRPAGEARPFMPGLGPKQPGARKGASDGLAQ